MAAKRRFDISDEVRGIVRLLDVGGPGAVTIEITATGQRITMADSTPGPSIKFRSRTRR